MQDSTQISFQKYHEILKSIDTVERIGKVMKAVGLTVESSGPEVNIGSICRIFHASGEKYVEAEVVGFKDQRVLLMPLGDMSGIGFGSRVISTGRSLQVPVSEKLVGRILDALGNPMDGGQPIAPEGYYPVDNTPPNPLDRAEIRAEFPLGIRAIDGLLTVGQGQRLAYLPQRSRKKHAAGHDSPERRGRCQRDSACGRARQGGQGFHQQQPGPGGP
jgi:flagellum-specific ATP synthase